MHGGIEPKVDEYVVKNYLINQMVHTGTLSFSNGIFPSELNVAKVVSFYKKDDRTSEACQIVFSAIYSDM
jgi:hypothetical protein